MGLALAFSFTFSVVFFTGVRVSFVLAVSELIDFFSSSAISFFDFGPVGGGFSACEMHQNMIEFNRIIR